MNCVTLVGNLTRDPELRQTNSGLATCTFTIAVNRAKAADGTQKADFIQIVTWRATAENCAKYLAKGRKIAVRGELHTRSYEKNGVKTFVTEVVANEVEFLTPRSASTGSPYPADASDAAPETPQGFTQIDDSELPF